ncbi:TPA: hypothetical protein ACSPKX_002518 [Pseudomonas aeruginosa]
MSSTQHQLIEQCATRLRGIVEALDNIHDTSPHRWSTDLDDVHSSAESLLALINDQASPPCIDCKGTGFCNSISGEEIRCPCHATIQFADPAQAPVEQFEQAPPSEDQLTAAGLSYPLAKEDAVNLWYAGFRSEVVTVLEAWEAIGHDIGMNPSKGELLDSLRNIAAICNAHGNDMPAQSAIDQRQAIADAITGALAFGAQASRPPPADHWLRPFYDVGRAEGQRTQELAMLVRMLASSLKRHAPESNLVARATNYLAAKGLADAALAQPSPAQAEAERPEVVGVRYEDGTILSAEDCGIALEVCAKVQTPLMTVAQHERIVEARWNRAMDLLLDHVSRISEKFKAERDAALANVDALAVQVLRLGGTISFAQHRTDQAGQVPQAWLDVQAERRRQVEAEGWTPEHDDQHGAGELADAAACYALWAGGINPGNWREFWPWAPEWLKHSEPRRMLVKACPLALAEIERLDRAVVTQGGPRDA